MPVLEWPMVSVSLSMELHIFRYSTVLLNVGKLSPNEVAENPSTLLSANQMSQFDTFFVSRQRIFFYTDCSKNDE